MGYYLKCFECLCFIKMSDKYNPILNNPKKCTEHKGKEFITQAEYDWLKGD